MNKSLNYLLGRTSVEDRNRAAAVVIADLAAFGFATVELISGYGHTEPLRQTFTLLTVSGLLASTLAILVTGRITLAICLALGPFMIDLVCQYVVSSETYYLAYLIVVPTVATLFGGRIQGVIWLALCYLGLVGLSATGGVTGDVATVHPIRQEWLTVALVMSGLCSAALWSVMMRDRSEAESRMLERQANSAEVLRGMGEYAGMVAHNFNNLLTAIACNGQLLESSNQRDAILTAVDRASELTSQLLSIAKPETVAVENLSLHSLITELRTAIQGIVRERVDVRFDLSAGADEVPGNRCLLQHVILNLTTNARDALSNGGQLSISTRQACLWSGGRQRPAIQLIVVDTGCGMSSEVLSRACEPFFTTKQSSQGTGLGLAFVTRIVGQLDGRFHVQSSSQTGTTVVITLPLAEATQMSEVSEAGDRPAAPARRSTQSHKCSILLVDDNELVLQATRRLLEHNSHHVVAAQSGEEALAMLMDGASFDLLVTDYVLPGLNGMELAVRVRQHQPKIGVVVISGYQDEPIDLDSLTTIGGLFVSKPFQLQDLDSAIQTLARRSEDEPV